MSDTNLVVYSGRLVEDPREVGDSGCKFTVASNRVVRSGDERERYTVFMPVLVWNKQASTVLRYLSKGSHVLVEGRLEQRKFERKDGSVGSEVSIVARNVQFLGTGGEKTAVKEAGASADTDSSDDELEGDALKLLARLMKRDK